MLLQSDVRELQLEMSEAVRLSISLVYFDTLTAMLRMVKH